MKKQKTNNNNTNNSNINKKQKNNNNKKQQHHTKRLDDAPICTCKPVLHDWCNKGRGTYYPVCGMMHIKEPLLLIGKNSLCDGSGFPLSLSLSELSFTICLTSYNRK